MRPTTYRQAFNACPAALKGLRARNDLFDLYNRCGVRNVPTSTSRQMYLDQLLNWGFRVNTVATDHWVLTPPGSTGLLHLYGEQELARYTGHHQWRQNHPKPFLMKGNDNNIKEPT
ncbi:hypothetical protein ACTXGQ_17220 [Marinobacter sp. 1Y8]